MSLRTEWPCWEIMKCSDSQDCPARGDTAKLCWELMEEVGKYSFNICKDCLVYISKQKDSPFSKEEILSIMAQKGVNVLTCRSCPTREGDGGKS